MFLHILEILSMLDWQTAMVNFLYMCAIWNTWMVNCCFMSKLIYRIFVATQDKIFRFKFCVKLWEYFPFHLCGAIFFNNYLVVPYTWQPFTANLKVNFYFFSSLYLSFFFFQRNHRSYYHRYRDNRRYSRDYPQKEWVLDPG